MKKAITSIVVILFAGLLCTSLLALFNGASLGGRYMDNQSVTYPYFMAY